MIWSFKIILVKFQNDFRNSDPARFNGIVTRTVKQSDVFGRNDALIKKFWKPLCKRFTRTPIHILCASTA